MPDPESRFYELTTALKEHDFRLTPQRLELVRLIAASEGHPSASQLYEKIKDRFPTMSPATVYKTLALLKEIGQVLEINLRDDHHYDGNRPKPHPHLICTQCNRITDVEFSMSPDIIQQMENITGYQILYQQITLYGLCSTCRNRK
jgi:Fur family peroxide stress response transcriptional regulator